MRVPSICRARRGAGPAWHDDVRHEPPHPRQPQRAAALLRRERRERRRVLAELAALLARNPFLDA